MNIWMILGIVLVAYMGFNIVLSIRLRGKVQARLLQEKEFYREIDEEKFDNIEDSKLVKGIVNQIWGIEDEDYINVVNNLTKGQLYIYTIYQMETIAHDQRVGMEYFYTTPYAPYLIESFGAVGANQLVDVFKEIESYQREQAKQKFDDEEEQVDVPTYYDFCEKYKEIASEIKLDALCVKYIREHKKDFINA